jgi:hypothetical protein
MDNLITTIIVLIVLAGSIVLIDNSVEQTTTEDYYIELTTIDDMDCVIIKQYSQVGITCDWSEHIKNQ